MRISEPARLFSERQGHFASEGVVGREVFDRLASDAELPNFFNEIDVAAICGLSVFAIKQRRARRMEPEFVSLSGRCVRYPREAVCRWLADLYRAKAA